MKPLIFKLSKCQVWLLELRVFPAGCAGSSRAVYWLLAAPSHCCLLETGNSPFGEGEKPWLGSVLHLALVSHSPPGLKRRW